MQSRKKIRAKPASTADPETQPAHEETPPLPTKGQPQTSPAEPAVEAVTIRNVIDSIFVAFGPEGTEDQKNEAKAKVRRYLAQIVEKHEVAAQYNIILLYDEMKMVQGDADSIYASVTKFPEKKPILLVLHSSGGNVGPAYLIGKLLNEYSGSNLEIVVPRLAKSAATLLCCAANHIHMGSLSELGPIDPQFEGLPALGLKSAIQHIAELVAEYPHATDLMSKYMSQSIKPIHLGFYERVAESAVQYAERLLHPHAAELAQKPAKIARDLVYFYKDHSFVIDRQEAQEIFGTKVVKHNTDEYHLGNALYQELVYITRIADIVNQAFYMIGSLTSNPGFIKKPK
jgi:membrane-bound ClpP family serine protease